MRVYMLKDVEKIGMSGEIIKVSDGFAANYLIPRKLAVEITAQNEAFYAQKLRVLASRKEVVAEHTSMLAEKIKDTSVTLKKKTHDGSALYGAISPHEIVDALAEKGIKVGKSQIVFDKSIKTKGTFEVTVRLSSRLTPKMKLKVVSE